MIPSARSILSRDACFLTRGIHRDYKKTLLVINFQRLIHPEIILKELTHPCAPQRERGSVPQATVSGTLFARGQTSKDTIPMPTLAGRPSTMCAVIPVEFPHNSMVGAQRQQNIGSGIRQIPYSTTIVGVEDTIQESSDYLL